MTLAFASMSPAGSSASAYEIIVSNTLECVIRYKAHITASPGGLPVKHCDPFVLTRIAERKPSCVIILLLPW